MHACDCLSSVTHTHTHTHTRERERERGRGRERESGEGQKLHRHRKRRGDRQTVDFLQPDRTEAIELLLVRALRRQQTKQKGGLSIVSCPLPFFLPLSFLFLRTSHSFLSACWKDLSLTCCRSSNSSTKLSVWSVVFLTASFACAAAGSNKLLTERQKEGESKKKRQRKRERGAQQDFLERQVYYFGAKTDQQKEHESKMGNVFLMCISLPLPDPLHMCFFLSSTSPQNSFCSPSLFRFPSLLRSFLICLFFRCLNQHNPK